MNPKSAKGATRTSLSSNELAAARSVLRGFRRGAFRMGGVALAAVSLLAAQERMPAIPQDQMTEAQKSVVKDITSGPRGVLNGPFIPLLRSPEFEARLQKVGEYLRYDNALGRKLTEFIILITARDWTQQFEWSVHEPLALQAGVKPEVAAAITDGRRPTGMPEDEEIVYDYCAELLQNKSVSDATYARAVKKFGEKGVIDMTGVVGYYSLLGMILNATRVPAGESKAPRLPEFPH
jgi:4-carboxymuconolactone decarboxylase